MALTGIETVVDELITQLRTYLPAQLVIAAAEAPALKMPAIPNEHYHFAEKPDQGAYPAIAFLPTRTPIPFERSGKFEMRHIVVIQPFVEEGNLELLSRKLLRTTVAIARTLVDRRDAFTFTLRFNEADDGWDYSPARAVPGSLFRRDAFMPVMCWKEEDR